MHHNIVNLTDVHLSFLSQRSRGSLIVREECGNSHAHSALLNADLICPDPIARQLLEEDGNSSSSPEKAKFSDWRHVFVPVSDAYEV